MCSGSGAALVLLGRLLCPTLLMDSWGTRLPGEPLFCLYQFSFANVVPGDDSEGGKNILLRGLRTSLTYWDTFLFLQTKIMGCGRELYSSFTSWNAHLVLFFL